MKIQITPTENLTKKKERERKENFDENQKNKRFIVMDKQYCDFLKTKNSIRTINFYHVIKTAKTIL